MLRIITGKKAFIFILLAVILFIGIKNNTFATAFRNIQEVEKFSVVINEVMAKNRSVIQDGDGDYSDYIELFNNSDTAVNLKGFGLSTNAKNPYLWRFPETVIEAYSFVVVFASAKDKTDCYGNLHTNFRIKNNDNVVILTSPGGKWENYLFIFGMTDNISCGRQPDGSETIAYFDGGTTGTKNTLKPLIEATRLTGVKFSIPAGFYENEAVLELTHEDKDVRVYYTIDGSVPTENSLLYENGILLLAKNNAATVIRACAVKSGYPASNVITTSYFIGQGIFSDYDVPVISIVTDPANLFDYEKGIYVAGKIQEDWLKAHPDAKVTYSTPANYNQKGKVWERPAHLEIFQPGGLIGLSQNVGIKTHGGYSLAFDNKSLRIMARDDYDDKTTLDYDFYLSEQTDDFPVTGIILRNSATDSQSSFFRDAFIQSLANPDRLDVQNYQPCVVFINGLYYGIYNIRTLYNAEYLASKYHFKSEDVVIIKNPAGEI
ncbi:MAG: chitobiase/beta-hexosaminidase C-terminal domain-containing protein, partial [Christensenellales bacterium]